MVHDNFRDYCFCFEFPGRKMNESYCNKICTGDSTLKCGSEDDNIASVYRTNPQTETDGGWSEWGNWVSNGEFCLKNRTRTCTNPIPSAGGANCTSEGSSRLIFPELLPVMLPPLPDIYLNSSLTHHLNTSGFDNMTGLQNMSISEPGEFETSPLPDIYLNSSLSNHLNMSGFDNMTGPQNMSYSGPEESEEPEFLPKDTESLQYQFMPWCAEDCLSKLKLFSLC